MQVRETSTSQGPHAPEAAGRGLRRSVALLLMLPIAVIGAQAGSPAFASEGCAGEHQDPSDTATVQACTPVVPPVVVPTGMVSAEVLPEQAFGKAMGAVQTSCQGTVRARLSNRSADTVDYRLRVGSKLHRITVKSFGQKKFVTHGPALAEVTLKVGHTRLDRVRIPALCEAPEVLPDTGLRATTR